MDTQSRNYILETIKSINQEQETTIIYTSHYMEEIEQVSDTIAILDEGRLLLHAAKETLLQPQGSVTIRVNGINDMLRQSLGRIASVRVLDDGIQLQRDTRLRDNLIEILLLLKKQGVDVVALDSRDKTLEALFLDITRKRLRDAC